MNTVTDHLLNHPEHRREVARWIHQEWWSEKAGHSVDTMETRLSQAADPKVIPLSLVALLNGTPVGTVNLVDNDNEDRPDLTPWLAALLVLPEHRGAGIGSELVRALMEEARGLGVPAMYLGTDIPKYYERFGARIHDQVRADYCIMRLPAIKS